MKEILIRLYNKQRNKWKYHNYFFYLKLSTDLVIRGKFVNRRNYRTFQSWLTHVASQLPEELLKRNCHAGLLALAGNGMVVWVFSFTRSLRSGTNILTINLAFSDLLMMLTQFPILVANCFNQSWTLGPLACEVRKGGEKLLVESALEKLDQTILFRLFLPRPSNIILMTHTKAHW